MYVFIGIKLNYPMITFLDDCDKTTSTFNISIHMYK